MPRIGRTRGPLVWVVATVAVVAVGYVLVTAADIYRQRQFYRNPDVDTVIPAMPPTRDLTWTEWDEAASPNYVTELGPATVDVTIPAGQIWYSPLDELGRAGRAAGTITYEMVDEGIAREREDTLDLRPSGWGHNEQVEIELPDGSTYSGFFYNRSHLVAKSLGGVDAIENLVWGTRTQNVGANDRQGGMSWCEQQARDWLFRHKDGTVFYSAQPVYEGDELVCRSVIVDIRSSDGSLDVEVEVHNCAKGYVIDYATGEFSPAP